MLVFDSEPRSADPALRVAPPVEPGIESVVEPAGAPGGEAVTSAEPGANKQADPLAPPADPRPDEQTDGRSVVPPEFSASCGQTRDYNWPARRGQTPGKPAPVAQLDRASVYETEGHRFESCRARSSGPLEISALQAASRAPGAAAAVYETEGHRFESCPAGLSTAFGHKLGYAAPTGPALS
jgi:hypothetical protein